MDTSAPDQGLPRTDILRNEDPRNLKLNLNLIPNPRQVYISVQEKLTRIKICTFAFNCLFIANAVGCMYHQPEMMCAGSIGEHMGKIWGFGGIGVGIGLAALTMSVGIKALESTDEANPKISARLQKIHQIANYKLPASALCIAQIFGAIGFKEVYITSRQPERLLFSLGMIGGVVLGLLFTADIVSQAYKRHH